MSNVSRTVRPWRREPRRAVRMIGCWPEGIRFEDADVPAEGWFKGQGRDVPAAWPESNLGAVGHIAGRRR